MTKWISPPLARTRSTSASHLGQRPGWSADCVRSGRTTRCVGRRQFCILLVALAAYAGCGSAVSIPDDADSGDVAGSGPSSGAGGTSSGETSVGSGAGSGLTKVVALDVEPQHIVADPERRVFYVTVGEEAAAHADSLVVVDAATATVTDSMPIGSQPAEMALSDDASTLWVSLRGTREIRRVDLASGSPQPGVQYALPPDEFGGAAYGGPMVVLAGTTSSVAVTLHGDPLAYAGAVVIDDGIPRPKHASMSEPAPQLTRGPPGWLMGSTTPLVTPSPRSRSAPMV